MTVPPSSGPTSIFTSLLIPTHAVVYEAIAAHKPALARRRMNELLFLVREEGMASRPPK
jgi:DNA-binding FadR family transcriptional regulator